MKIRFWGVRGSIPSPELTKEHKNKIKKILQIAIDKKLHDQSEIDTFINNLPFHLQSLYGGNTTCIEINDEKGNVFILDAGTGIRLLGNDLIKRSPKTDKVHLFFTHFHWDHIQGFPFFIPAYLKDFNLYLYSTKDNFQNILYRQQNVHNFPRKLSEMASNKTFTQIFPGESIKIGDITIDCLNLYHPGGGTAYSFTENGKKVIFTGDVEFVEEDIGKTDKYNDFFNNAEIIIMDSQYTLEESFYKFDWGHTSYTMAVNLAINWKAKNLYLTHFDPTYPDETISKIENLSKDHVKENGLYKLYDLKVKAAYENLVLEV
jgi:phosphoribosyl 1,2-cyclic phosphodiesterase